MLPYKIDDTKIERHLIKCHRQERGILDLQSHELALKQKRVEANLTDLTRCIRGMEFDVKVNSNRERKERKSDRRPPADKKSPKVGDFSE